MIADEAKIPIIIDEEWEPQSDEEAFQSDEEALQSDEEEVQREEGQAQREKKEPQSKEEEAEEQDYEKCPPHIRIYSSQKSDSGKDIYIRKTKYKSKRIHSLQACPFCEKLLLHLKEHLFRKHGRQELVKAIKKQDDKIQEDKHTMEN